MSPPLKASSLLFGTLSHSMYIVPLFIMPSFFYPPKHQEPLLLYVKPTFVSAISALLMVELKMALAPSTSCTQRGAWWHSLCPTVGFFLHVSSLVLTPCREEMSNRVGAGLEHTVYWGGLFIRSFTL